MPRKRTSKERESRRNKCVNNYKSAVKLNSVRRWPSRIANCRELTLRYIAEQLGKAPPRISEYMTFLIEPPDHTFDKIEKILYDHGV